VKVEAYFFGGGAPLFTVFAIVYGSITGWAEPVGVACLFLTAGLALLIGVYLFFTGRHIDPRPEDDRFGEIAEGAGELGEFAPYSWWPLAAAAGGAMVFTGMAIGWWLMALGAGVSALGVIGWVFEFYRGDHAH
jgi:uncharacterized membrane protein